MLACHSERRKSMHHWALVLKNETKPNKNKKAFSGWQNGTDHVTASHSLKGTNQRRSSEITILLLPSDWCYGKHANESTSCAWARTNFLIKMMLFLTERLFQKPHTFPTSSASNETGCIILDNSFQKVIDCSWIYKHLHSLCDRSWMQHYITSEKLRIYVCI